MQGRCESIISWTPLSCPSAALSLRRQLSFLSSVKSGNTSAFDFTRISLHTLRDECQSILVGDSPLLCRKGFAAALINRFLGKRTIELAFALLAATCDDFFVGQRALQRFLLGLGERCQPERRQKQRAQRYGKTSSHGSSYDPHRVGV